jgi:uncharacterized protein (DUF2267 family)
MTSQSQVSAFATTLQKTHQWLQRLADLAALEDQSQAYTALRAVLHALRDRLTINEAADLGAQLPMLVRGIYYEGWNPSRTPRTEERHLDEFLDHVRKELDRNALRIEPNHATRCVFALLSDKVTEGEINEVKQMLPHEVRELWPAGREAA